MKNTPLIWVDKVTILLKRRLYDRRIIRDQFTKTFFNQGKSLLGKLNRKN